MTSEYENMAKLLMSSTQGNKIMKGLDKFNAAVSSPSGKQLLTMLAGSGSDALKLAAQAAVNNDKEPARTLLSTLLSTKEGAALTAKIIEVAGV